MRLYHRRVFGTLKIKFKQNWLIMARFICKFTDNGTDYYLEWSTIVDAPVTCGMSREEFTNFYREEYGRDAMRFEFPERMKRVDEKGTSARVYDNVDEVLMGNKAGKNGERLSKGEIIEKYCRRNHAV